MDEFKYRTVFAAKVKAIQEPDEALKIEGVNTFKEAKASLENLRGLAASLSPDDDPDLLYIVANLAVAGKVNLNDDALSTQDALAVYKKFEKKFVDIEHNRAHVCGFIIKAGLSEFGTDRLISEEEAKTLPFFNITTVSILWKAVNRPLCNLVIDSSNPASPYYKDVSLSFEVGFDSYAIGVGAKNSRDLVDVKRIVKPTDDTFKDLNERLRAEDGSGVTEDGNNIIFRILQGNMIPLGQGIVTEPAAQVKGIEVIEDDNTMNDKEIESALTTLKMEANEKNINLIKSALGLSKITGQDLTKAVECMTEAINKYTTNAEVRELVDSLASMEVTITETEKNLDNLINKLGENNIKTAELGVSITINANKTMKYNTLEDIEKNWAELVKPEANVSFAGARELFTSTILAESKRLDDEAKAAKDAVEKSKKELETAVNAQNESQKLLTEVKAELDAIKSKQVAAEAETQFNERMAAIAEKFDFSDEERKLIVAKIRNLNAEEYKVWTAEADILYKEKTKAYKVAEANKLRDSLKEAMTKAGIKTVADDKEINFAEIFASVKVTDSSMHNNLELQGNSSKDLMTKAFGNISLKKDKK